MTHLKLPHEKQFLISVFAALFHTHTIIFNDFDPFNAVHI